MFAIDILLTNVTLYYPLSIVTMFQVISNF